MRREESMTMRSYNYSGEELVKWSWFFLFFSSVSLIFQQCAMNSRGKWGTVNRAEKQFNNLDEIVKECTL